MEINESIVTREQLMQNLPNQSIEISASNSISVYSGELTTICVINNDKKLKAAFPALPIGFYNILHEMIKEDGFSDSRLNDSVKHLIKNCIYPTPTLANILSFDRRVKLYSWKEVCDYVDKGGSMNDFIKREINGSMFRILKSDAIQHGLTE